MELNQNIIIGRNAVLEAIRASHHIDHILISNTKHNKTIYEIIKLAKQNKIPIKDSNSKKLDSLCNNSSHQGIIAFTSAFKYSQISDIFDLAKEKNEDPFILILDGIEDPHNFGAIIRTAECAGAHGIIIPIRNSAEINYTVNKTSAGAIEYIPIVRVTNISNLIDEIKKLGVWVFGAEANGDSYNNTDLSGPIALVIGSEGKGISKLVQKKCDKIISLPLNGHINSLNASVATGILIYEILRQRSNI